MGPVTTAWTKEKSVYEAGCNGAHGCRTFEGEDAEGEPLGGTAPFSQLTLFKFPAVWLLPVFNWVALMPAWKLFSALLQAGHHQTPGLNLIPMLGDPWPVRLLKSFPLVKHLPKPPGSLKGGREGLCTCVQNSQKKKKRIKKEKGEERTWREGEMVGKLQVWHCASGLENQWIPASEEHQGSPSLQSSAAF